MVEITMFKNELKILENAENILINDLKNIVKNKAIDLDTRYTLFVESDLGEHESFVVHWDSLKEGDLESEFIHNGETFPKYSTITVSDIEDALVDYEVSEETITNFKEEVLEKFIYSYTFDW